MPALHLTSFVVLLCTATTSAMCSAAHAKPSQKLTPRSLEKRVRKTTHRAIVPSLSDAELQAAERLFVQTLDPDSTLVKMRSAWSKRQWEIRVLPSPDGRGKVWLIREEPGGIRGRGCYVVHRGAAPPLALQAPHGFADRHTRQIAAGLFCAGRVRAVAFNTAHRRLLDAAHTPRSYLQAFTKAFLRVHGRRAVICQLHGFSQMKRTSAAGRTSDLILSNGSRAPAIWQHRLATTLRGVLPKSQVNVFPTEVSELGATTNVQGRLVRSFGYGRFCHLEMSAPLRETMRHDARRQTELLKALHAAFRTEE